MAKAKFKVGDKVRILDGSKIENYTGGWSTWGMKEDVGKVVTIKEVHEYSDDRIGYRMNEIICIWDERGLELVESKDKDKETIVIYRDGNEVIALNKKTKEKAVAKCNPSDEFDFKIGAGLAFDRLMNKFKVGDWVIGNDKAAERYCVTGKGYAGKVVHVSEDGSEIHVTNNSADTSGYCVKSECFDFHIPTDKELKKFKPKKKWTAKVVCVERAPYFTVGKVYEINNGVLKDDEGDVRLYGDIESLEYLNKNIAYGGKFIELVE